MTNKDETIWAASPFSANLRYHSFSTLVMSRLLSTKVVNWSQKEIHCVYSPLNEGRVSLGSFVVRLPIDGVTAALGPGGCNCLILPWHQFTALSAATNTSAASSTSASNASSSSMSSWICESNSVSILRRSIRNSNVACTSSSATPACRIAVARLVKTPRWAPLDRFNWANFCTPPEPSEPPGASAVDITSRSPMFWGSSQARTGELKKKFKLGYWGNSKIEFKLIDLNLVSRQEICIW